MRLPEVVQLIGLSYSQSATGDQITENEPREIFAKKKSIRQSEFYQAMANALRPEAIFEVWLDEYRNEPRLVHEGTLYQVIRTYETDNRMLELVCAAFDDIRTNLSRLRTTIEIWGNSSAENSMGEKSPLPERLFTVQAEVDYKGGGTGLGEGDVIETTNNLKATIVYRDGITPDMFLLVNGQRWNIEYIENPFNRNETLQIMAKRVIP